MRRSLTTASYRAVVVSSGIEISGCYGPGRRSAISAVRSRFWSCHWQLCCTCTQAPSRSGCSRPWNLFAVALAHGIATVFFDVSYQSYLPALVARSELMEGNAKLGASQSVAEVSGPTLGSFLVELFTAPLAVMADAISFLGSAIFLGMIGRSEASPERSERRHLVGEIGEGLGFVLRHPILRMIAATTGTANFFSSAVAAVIVVFLVRSVDLSAGGIGVLMSAGGIGGILGAFTASAIATRIGQARTIWLSVMTTAPFGLLIPFTERGAGLAFYVAGILPVSFGVAVHNVARVSFRQALCPARLLGRMNATMRFLVWGTTPLGALLGGALGTWIGLRPTLWASQVGEVLAAGRVIASPLRTMRDFPAQNTADARWRLPAGASGKPCR